MGISKKKSSISISNSSDYYIIRLNNYNHRFTCRAFSMFKDISDTYDFIDELDCYIFTISKQRICRNSIDSLVKLL